MNHDMDDEHSPINILMIGLTRSERNSLHVILPRRLGRKITLAAETGSAPDLILVSPDTTGAMKQYREVLRHTPGTPTVCLSREKQELESAVWVARPVKADQLVHAIVDLLHRPSPTTGEEEPQQPGKTSPKKKEPVRTGHTRVCDPSEKLIGIALDARERWLKSGRAVIVEGLGYFLFTPDGLVITNNSENVWRSMCVTHLLPNAVSIRNIRQTEMKKLLDSQERKYVHDQEAFLWRLAAYCSRGALPKGIRSDDTFSLYRWPNCTRLPEPLKIAAISAVFQQSPVCTDEVSRRLEMDIEEIATFVACADALKLLKPAKPGTSARSTGNSRHKAGGQSSGILGKLAKKLVGRVFGKDRKRA